MFAILEIESFTPKPAITRDVQPAMPKSIINIRFLNRNTFLADTLCRNFSRFQTKGIRSNRIRFPAAGALGRINSAGTLESAIRQAAKVVPAEHNNATSMDIANSPISSAITISANPYSMPYAVQIAVGNRRVPRKYPLAAPMTAALPEYSIYLKRIAPSV